MPLLLIQSVAFLPLLAVGACVAGLILKGFEDKNFWYYFAFVMITISLAIYLNDLTIPALGKTLSAEIGAIF